MLVAVRAAVVIGRLEKREGREVEGRRTTTTLEPPSYFEGFVDPLLPLRVGSVGGSRRSWTPRGTVEEVWLHLWNVEVIS